MRKLGISELRKFGNSELRNLGIEEIRKDGNEELRKFGRTEMRNLGIEEIRRDGNEEIRIMEKYMKDNRRKFNGVLKPLMTEDEKNAPSVDIVALSYDFACRITRLYKFLNEGMLEKADRDIIDAFGRQLLRSASSINANLNEGRHPQSDADYLSKANISLKEARESENWLNLFHDNGYLSHEEYNSLNNDLNRILKILVTIVNKVSSRLKYKKKK